MRYFTFLENGAMSLKKYDNKRGFIITILYPNNPDTCFFLDPSKHGPYHRYYFLFLLVIFNLEKVGNEIKEIKGDDNNVISKI